MQDGSYPSQLNLGAFVGTTNVWDVSEIYNKEGLSEPLKELLVRLYQNLNNMSVLLNLKETGYYPMQEFVTSSQYFPNPTINDSQTTAVYRQVYRMTVNFGALPNATTKSVAHNIPVMNGYSFTRCYAMATNPATLTSLPIPYAALTLNQNIQISADQTNVTIITGIDYSAYTTTYVVLEYIKQ